MCWRDHKCRAGIMALSRSRISLLVRLATRAIRRDAGCSSVPARRRGLLHEAMAATSVAKSAFWPLSRPSPHCSRTKRATRSSRPSFLLSRCSVPCAQKHSHAVGDCQRVRIHANGFT